MAECHTLEHLDGRVSTPLKLRHVDNGEALLHQVVLQKDIDVVLEK